MDLMAKYAARVMSFDRMETRLQALLSREGGARAFLNALDVANLNRVQKKFLVARAKEHPLMRLFETERKALSQALASM